MFDPDSDPRWRLMLPDRLVERAKALFLTHPVWALDFAHDYEIHLTVPPAVPGASWLVFRDSEAFGKAVDALWAEGIVPLVQDDIESVRFRRDRLGLPYTTRP